MDIRQDRMADWGQGNPSHPDYIKGRTHYEQITEYCNLSYQEPQPYRFTYDIQGSLVVGEEYNVEVEINGTTYNYTVISDHEQGWGDVRLATSNGNINYSNTPSYEGNHNGLWVGVPNVTKLKITKTVIQTLNEKFIPDTIARVESIKQSDWNQSDENEKDYIQNRTHWTEFINHNDVLCDCNAEVSYYNQYTSIAIVSWIGEPIQSREELDHLIIRYNGIEIPHMTSVYQSPTRWWISDNYNTFGIGFGVAPGYHYELYGGYVGRTLNFEVKSVWTETVYHKIDERYIPDTIARQSVVDSLIGSLDSTAGIASIQNDVVTLKKGIVQTDGLVENNSEQDIELAKVAKTGSYGDLVDKLFVKENTSNLTQAMQPNTLYTWTNALTSSDILAPTLTTPTNANIIAEYMGKFTTGETVPTLNFPDNIIWQTGLPTLQPLYTYEFSIIDNIGIFSPMGYVTEADVQTMINANKLKWNVIS